MKTKDIKSHPRFLSRTLDVSTCAMSSIVDAVERMAPTRAGGKTN